MTFYSIPGVRYGSGGDRQERDHDQVDEALRRIHPEFYAERERRRREEPDAFASGFTVGEEASWKGEKVTVEHVEKDGSRERLWLRGERTGTFLSHWEKTGDGSATLSDARPTKD